MHSPKTLWLQYGPWLLPLTAFFLPISVFAVNVCLATLLIGQICSGKWQDAWQYIRQEPALYMAMILGLALLFGVFINADLGAGFAILHKYQKLLMLLIFVPFFLQDARWRHYSLIGFLAAMCVNMIADLIMHGLNPTIEAGAVFRNHIETGFFMAFAAFVCAHCYRFSQKKIYLGLSLLFSFHVLFINQGRTGYVIFFTLFIFYLWQVASWRGLVQACGLASLLFIGLLYLSPAFSQGVHHAWQGLYRYYQHQPETDHLVPSSEYLRSTFIKNSLTLMAEKPWLGFGTGGFKKIYYEKFGPSLRVNGHEFILEDPHNEYLFLGVQLGLFGVLLLMSLFIVAFYQARLLPPLWRALATGFILAYAVANLFDAFLFLFCPGYFFVFFLSLFYAGIPVYALNHHSTAVATP